MTDIARWTVTADPAGELRAVGYVIDPELGHPLGWRAVEVVTSATYQGAVDTLAKIERVYQRTMPGPRDDLRDRVLELIAAYRASARGR